MKKLTAIVMTLVLALLCCVSVTASAGSTPTFVWEDCAIQLLSYKIVKIAYSSAHMDLYARVLNNKDYKISVWLENADIDGVEVTVGPIVLIDPHSDTGTEDPVSFYVFAPSANKEAASDAIVNARTLSGTLELRNDETNEVMLRQKHQCLMDRGAADGKVCSDLRVHDFLTRAHCPFGDPFEKRIVYPVFGG